MKFLALLLFLPLLALAEPATVIRATDLKKEPATRFRHRRRACREHRGRGARAQERLDAREGRRAAKAGCACFRLRLGGAAATKPGASGLTQMFNVARTGTSGTQVTTGVRGLDAEQIANAQPNPAELAKLEKFAADRDAATGFASQGKLSPTSVDYPK